MDDRILEHELVHNERVINHKRFGELRLKRPTPAMERQIAEQRRKVYHKDLQDESILTKDEVQKMLEKRGIWSSVQDDRIKKLTEESGTLMVKLTALGYESVNDLYESFSALESQLREDFKDLDDVEEVLGRLFNTEADMINADLHTLRTNSTNSDMVARVDELVSLRMQYVLLVKFAEVKKELNELLNTYTVFFADTIEERAQQAEKMATIYTCVRKPNGGPLWEAFEQMWDEDPDTIAWLSAQYFYFQHGIDDTYAETLQKHGFMGRVNATENSSEDSQDLPQPSSDGESPEPTQPDSSELEAATS